MIVFLDSYFLLFNFSDPPEVETEQTFIHTTENDETEVICTVHASPKAEVVWFKDGEIIGEKQALFKHLGNRHSIILTGINEPIYGVYKCKATNKFGSDEATTEVSGNKTAIYRVGSGYILEYFWLESSFKR